MQNTTKDLTRSSIELINQSLETIDLKPGPRVLLARIISWSGSKGKCWHKLQSIAEKMGISVRTVQRWKRDLIQAGYLSETPSPYRSPYLIPIVGTSVGVAVTSGVTDLSPLSLKEKTQLSHLT